ncbi:MAG: hypothetical protein HQ474_11245 [Flammeovirgaceae bacterium]|jgi:phosphoribosylanthranilate isomerase|nr:hypothetical protein [Flammeovirgaceae bacterium]|tara:strand:- start:34574 stop:35176 length:603 start_codon:yes stop_codon:yes gene_type:complete
MALKKFVKISGVTSLSDARYCSGMMVDVLGFNLNQKDTNHIEINILNQIKAWINGPMIAGEFSDASIEEIQEVMGMVDLDIIETNRIDLIEPLQNTGKRVYFKISVDSQIDIDELIKLNVKGLKADKIILTASSNLFMTQSVHELMNYQENVKIVNGFHLELGSINLWTGVELRATAEEVPGLKDYGKIMEVLEFLEIDD